MALFSDVLLTVDFDRTLTAPDSTIPARNLAAIARFMENGGAFTVNTGRSAPMFARYMAQIPANAPFLLYNGSAAWENGQLTQTFPIPLDPLELVQQVHAHFPELLFEVQGADAHYAFRHDAMWERFYTAQQCAHGVAPERAALMPFLKFSIMGKLREENVDHLFFGSPEELARMDAAQRWLNAQYGDRLTIFRPAARIIDGHARGVSKLAAARALQARLGRRLLVCVGDAENDVPMLSGADLAFCPADGTVADRFPNVCPCAQGAVADVIERLPAYL